MALSLCCARQFGDRVKRRGDEYYRQGRVTIERATRGLVTASVRGSREGAYQVRIHVRGDVIAAACSCPYASLGTPCKHLWAVLRAADAREVSPPPPDRPVFWLVSGWPEVDGGRDDEAADEPLDGLADGAVRVSIVAREDGDGFDMRAAVVSGGRTAPLAPLAGGLTATGDAASGEDPADAVPEAWRRQWRALSRLGEPAGDALWFRHGQVALLDVLLPGEPPNNDDEDDEENDDEDDDEDGRDRGSRRADNDAGGVVVRADAAFTRLRRKLRARDGVGPVATPRGFRGKLRPHQRQALGWLCWLAELGLGGCLADDPGLGKTALVLALLQRRRVTRRAGRPPSVVVVPRERVARWNELAATLTPNLRVSQRESFTLILGVDAILMTYDAVHRNHGRAPVLDYAILDDAIAIADPASPASAACRALPAQHRLALVSVAVDRRIGEFVNVFEFLNPGFLGGARAVTELAAFAASGATASADVLAPLARALRPLILRRTRAQVAGRR